MSEERWDHSVDVLVVGSGNGGMTSALCNYEMGTRDVLVIEKGDTYGGTSCLSGGGVWIPCNRYAKAEGAADSIDEARTYLGKVIPDGMVPQPLIDTYLENGPKMVDFLHERTEHVRYESLAHYPDYYSLEPGARHGHRSMEPARFDMSQMGDDWKKMAPSHQMMLVLGRICFTQVEAAILASRSPGWFWVGFKLMLRWIIDLPWHFKSLTSRFIACGRAGIGRLRLEMIKRGLPLWLNSALEELITDDQGRVIGAVVRRDGKSMRVQANKGVVIASGGFEHNQAMREQYLPAPTNEAWSSGAKTNTGDGILAGQAVGGAIGLMNTAWWTGTVSVPGEENPRLSIMDKGMPGTVLVNQQGKRIANESMNYYAYQSAVYDFHSDETPAVPAYMIFAKHVRDTYYMGPLMGNLQPDFAVPNAWYEDGFFKKAETIRELAGLTGIDPDGLEDTVSRMNQYAASGVDEEFHRGETESDRYYGDQRVQPNPCLGPIADGPFYAMRVDPGDFGTSGGLEFNTDAQVLKDDGSAIDGLYVCGNSARAVLPGYPGPGSTLGPAMTFAYQSAKHINGVSDS